MIDSGVPTTVARAYEVVDRLDTIAATLTESLQAELSPAEARVTEAGGANPLRRCGGAYSAARLR